MNSKDYQLDASLYYSEVKGYSLYVLRNHAGRSACVAAFQLKNFQRFVKTFEIFLRRDNFGNLDDNIDHESIEAYNLGWSDPEFVHGFIQGIPGTEFGQVINNEIIIYPAFLPTGEQVFWRDLFMHNPRITLSRSGFKL